MAKMRVILPLSACESHKKSAQFLGLLKNIAAVTLESEPRCLAYAWFQGDQEANKHTIPVQWVRGFEVYEDISALANDHRSSVPYKTMRSVVGAEKVLSKPTDLRFLQPTGIGFLARDAEQSVLQHKEDIKQVVLVKEYDPPSEGEKSKLLDSLRSLADYVTESAKENGILTFWVLEYDPEYQDHGIKVIVRFIGKSARELHESSDAVTSMNAAIATHSLTERVTEWVASGIGFIGR